MQLHHIKQILPLKLILKLIGNTFIWIEVIGHLTYLRNRGNVLDIGKLIIDSLGAYLTEQETKLCY